MKKSFADILNDVQNVQQRKMAAKLPVWEQAGCTAPTKLCLEQCSSEKAALYKADLAARCFKAEGEGLRCADLTGGFGVDSWAFSRLGGQVLYNERNPELLEAVRQNYGRLGVSNAVFHGFDVDAQGFEEGQEDSIGTALRRFRPDFIYIDPARRSEAGKKVFLLEDCSPNVLGLIPHLKGITRQLMLKLSPMADISMVTSRLESAGAHIREIHVLGVDGEVKELLCVLDLEAAESDGWSITAAGPGSEPISFSIAEENSAAASLAGEIRNGDILYEPSPVVLKAGCYRLLCSRYGFRRLDRFTHLYLTGGVPDTKPMGKYFSIKEVLPLNKACLKAVRSSYPKAEVSARNIPMSSDELRTRLGVKPGAEYHIFGVSAYLESEGQSSNLLLVTQRI